MDLIYQLEEAAGAVRSIPLLGGLRREGVIQRSSVLRARAKSYPWRTIPTSPNQLAPFCTQLPEISAIPLLYSPYE